MDLSYNKIEDVGVIVIANRITENNLSSLNTLNLESNEIGIMGARSMADMLTNKSLTEQNLDYNKMIGTDGVITIAEALKQNESLITLTLSYIPFGDDGARSIGSMLKTN